MQNPCFEGSSFQWSGDENCSSPDHRFRSDRDRSRLGFSPTCYLLSWHHQCARVVRLSVDERLKGNTLHRSVNRVSFVVQAESTLALYKTHQTRNRSLEFPDPCYTRTTPHALQKLEKNYECVFPGEHIYTGDFPSRFYRRESR